MQDLCEIQGSPYARLGHRVELFQGHVAEERVLHAALERGKCDRVDTGTYVKFKRCLYHPFERSTAAGLDGLSNIIDVGNIALDDLHVDSKDLHFGREGASLCVGCTAA